MQKKGKVLITVFSVIGVGVGVYLLSKKYGWFKRNTETDEGNYGGNNNSDNNTSTTSKVYTPFKSKAEGDAFREWVNNTYPVSARLIDLDKSGSYNNKFIGEAWDKYGDEYSKLAMLLEVKAKIGIGAELKKDAVEYFQGANNSQKVFFYNSGKYQIYNAFWGMGTTMLQKGTYSSGGQILKVTEGKNEGRTFENGSVRTNLINSLK